MVFDEWTQLEQIILGRGFAPCFPKIKDIEYRNGLEKIFEETEEDLLALENILSGLGVRVFRPAITNISQFENTQSQYPYPPLCPRDFLLVYQNKKILCRGGDPNRFNEGDYFSTLYEKNTNSPLLYDIAMPISNRLSVYANYQMREGEPLFHAANILKCGTHLLHSRPYNSDGNGRGTYSGLNWIKQQFKDVKWIECPFVGHADGKIALVRPGLLLTWAEDFIPEELRSWDKIIVPQSNLPDYFRQIKINRFYKEFVCNWLSHWIGCVDETVFDLNFISINEHLIISNGYNKYVYDELKKRDIEAIPFNFRHKYFWDSGLHCLTLDIQRKGGPEDYITEQK